APMPSQPAPMPGMPKPPVMGQPAPMPSQPAPMPGMPKPPVMGQPAPMPSQPAPMPGMPKPPVMGQPAPMPSAAPAPNQAPAQAANQTPNNTPAEAPAPGEFTMGSLVGQLGVKPVPHIIRKKTGEAINITKSEFSIGKSKTKADYAIENNTAISRVHCIIVQKDGVNYIKDNNSTNHTYVNGVELEPGKEVLLKNKTVIQLGDEEFTFLLRKGE
ncbi:MAG: FHA domain-containing protein, partial [Lachnospiraceae bacterium]|nr:FHA domain-containing protein [Lachnospiraceae bacterium]